jgi:hypothetical protein
MVVLQMSSTPEKSTTNHKWRPVASIRSGSKSFVVGSGTSTNARIAPLESDVSNCMRSGTPNSVPVAALLPETPDGNDEVSPHESASVSSAPIQSDASTDEDRSTSLDAEVRTSADPAKVSVSGAVYAQIAKFLS